MKCYKCGESNLDDARFCRSCGANLTEQTTQKETMTKKDKPNFDFKTILHSKKFIIGAVCGVLALILIIAISAIGSSAKADLCFIQEDYIFHAYSTEDENTSLFYNGFALDTKIDGDATQVSANLKGDVAAFISEDNVLYVVEKDTVQKIADDIIDAVLSYDGSIMAYLNQDATLYTIELSNRKIEKIADDVKAVAELGDTWFTFSPDGNTLLYSSTEDDECAFYVKNGSDNHKLDNFIGLYTSDDGKIIYGFNKAKEGDSYNTDQLCVYDISNDSSMKLANDCDDFLLNNKYDELIFTFDSKYYISINGDERIKIGNYTYLCPILPENASDMQSSIDSISAANTFIGTMLVYCEDGTYGIGYIDDNYEMQEVIKNIGTSLDNVYLSEDYNSIYYIRNENLYFATRENDFEPEKLLYDVESYKVSPDGKKIYYVNTDAELVCYFNEEEKMIAEDVSAENLAMSNKGVLYFISDIDLFSGILYRCNDGKNKVRIADDVFSVEATPKFVAYSAGLDLDDFYVEVYISTNEKDFNKLIEISY